MKRLIYLCVFMLFCIGIIPASATESDEIPSGICLERVFDILEQ